MREQHRQSSSPDGLGLPAEFLLTLLNEKTGYFHQVPGWHLNCAVAGAALAELSLQARVDTDLSQMILLDDEPVGEPVLDFVLAQIVAESDERTAQYWVERLAQHANLMIDLTLDRLQQLQLLEHHDGGFWTRTSSYRVGKHVLDGDEAECDDVTARIEKCIVLDHIPDPRDIILVSLAASCDVLRFIFELNDADEERIQLICQMDLIGRAITGAVSENIVGGLAHRSSLTRVIPRLPVRRLILNRNLRNGNVPAGFAELAAEFGPVFQLKTPFVREPMIFLAGLQINRWFHRSGRNHLRSADYLSGLESAYDASGLLPALDGAEHFRMRKALRPSYSRRRLEDTLETTLTNARRYMSRWEAGETLGAVSMCRGLANAHVTPFHVSLDGEEVVDDVMSYESRVLTTQVARALPKILLRTPGMRRRSSVVDQWRDQIVEAHTAAKRAGCPRDFADDVLSLHRSDPVFVPETNLSFLFSAPLLASMYVGDELSFAAYAMLSHPDIYARVRSEADAIFAGADPSPEDFNAENIDVTRRLILETLRLYPTVAMSMRTVMNSCMVDGHELPAGARVVIATTAPHYMSEVFPDPHVFDIDRYLPERDEHRTPGYAPFGLGTHSCMGSNLVELQLAISLLLLAYHFELAIQPTNYRLKISPFPSLSPNNKLKFTVTARRNELNA